MTIDLDELRDGLGYLDNMSGEVVYPDRPDGMPASERPQEALRRAAADIDQPADDVQR